MSGECDKQTILETHQLTKRFAELTAVDSLSISLMRGDIFGLLGPNGAGKTTVIKMLTTLLPPTSGGARIAGCDVIRDAAKVRRLFGYVPQLLSADGSLTGYENLKIFAGLYDIPRSERTSRISDALTYMGLSDVGNTLVRNYSGGMIRRLEIAQSMIHRPQILFLDEPTVGLDPTARRVVWEHISQLCADYGTTVFLTTHYMDEAEQLCTRLAFMHHGKVTAEGSPEQLKASIGGDGTTLDDVFAYYTGGSLQEGGNYRETARTRRTSYRVG